MSLPIEALAIYLHLARAGEQRQRPHERDRMLILAAVIATHADLPRIAACCRQRVLEHNPHHLISRWPDLASALASEDFPPFLKQLHRRYPRERAEQMLRSLGIEMGREREAYYTDEEYAAALLGVSTESLGEFGGD